MLAISPWRPDFIKAPVLSDGQLIGVWRQDYRTTYCGICGDGHQGKAKQFGRENCLSLIIEGAALLYSFLAALSLLCQPEKPMGMMAAVILLDVG